MKKTAVILLVALLFSITACTSGSGGESYTVAFESNGGSRVANIKTSQLTEAPASEKDGQIFCGWYKDSELTSRVEYPLNLDKDITLYARWSNAEESIECSDAAVQFSYDNSYSYAASYLATPKSLDLEALAAQGYYIKIEASYNVYYEKDFESPFDIGYLGAPDHDVCIADIYDKGTYVKDTATSTTATAETISHVVSAEELSHTAYYLRLMTYNLQNIVYFTDVNITLTVLTSA